MQAIHVFQKIERALRMQPEAHRWRVTLRDETVEVFRRPVLTSAVTLGALGLTGAPMPVPILVATVHIPTPGTAVITDLARQHEIPVPVHEALARVLGITQAWVDPDAA